MLTASIITPIAQRTSETSVSSHEKPRRNVPEDSHLHTHRRENLKFHLYRWFKELSFRRGSADSSLAGLSLPYKHAAIAIRPSVTFRGHFLVVSIFRFSRR
jgi:hypothetical protein